MSRWEPNARGRLEEVALQLYSERGFDQTTVAEIAQRAGLTERTFFRHFSDKREVLFGGEDALDEIVTRAIADAEASPIDAFIAGLMTVSELFRGRAEHARRRQAVIAANPALQERELIKLSRLAASSAEALRRRGVREPAASVAAETAIAVFKVSYEQWVGQSGDRDLSAYIRDALKELKAVASEWG